MFANRHLFSVSSAARPSAIDLGSVNGGPRLKATAHYFCRLHCTCAAGAPNDADKTIRMPPSSSPFDQREQPVCLIGWARRQGRVQVRRQRTDSPVSAPLYPQLGTQYYHRPVRGILPLPRNVQQLCSNFNARVFSPIKAGQRGATEKGFRTMNRIPNSCLSMASVHNLVWSVSDV
ncbi:hypothetical protein V9T40_001753 [Parthenolecanium corni]|uniref:Uncharacterized protein n=1 Tax=Parthenolecanium corni TaxID=536013 RepID=A0AAN9THN7_9HEMI